MADTAGSSSMRSKSDKPVIVRVKRKASQSRLEAFWLEINERPLKRPLLDFEKLSISDSSGKEELKTKKVLVEHVETVISSEVTIDILKSFVPNARDTFGSRLKKDDRRRSVKVENQKQEQLLLKAKHKQEVLSKNARFEQIWRSRKGKTEAMHDEALHEMCHLYDVVRVDNEETTEVVQHQEDIDLEDHRIMASYLPLLREFIPSAAEEIESGIHDYMSERASAGDYVYDLYAVNGDINVTEEDASGLFPLVQVDDDDFYDGPNDSEFESDDSNAEDNPLNDYPDEEASEDEEIDSRTSNDESDEHGSVSGSSSNHSSKLENFVLNDRSGDGDLSYEDEFYDNDTDDYDAYDYGEDGTGDDNWRWSYR